MRGWAKELLVTFSLILGLFLISILENVAPFVKDVIQEKTTQQFWLRTIIVSSLVFFGYQTPNISRFAAAMRREKISDSLLGFFLGAINGFLVVGSIWFFMAYAEYPFEYFMRPVGNDSLSQAAIEIIDKLPPAWLGTEPWIYVAVGLAFLFVLVVFI